MLARTRSSWGTDRWEANHSIAYLSNQFVESKLNQGWINEAEGSYPNKSHTPLPNFLM